METYVQIIVKLKIYKIIFKYDPFFVERLRINYTLLHLDPYPSY